MFSRNMGKDSICIHVGDSKPNALLDNARRLRETLKQNAQKKEVRSNEIPAVLDDEDDDDVVLIIPTPSQPYEEPPVVSVENDVDPIPTPVTPEKQPTDDVSCEEEPVMVEEHAVEDDMDSDIDIEVYPIPTPLQILKPKGWKPPKTEFRPKLPVLRRSRRHVEINPPSPGNINDVIIENAELLNEIN